MYKLYRYISLVSTPKTTIANPDMDDVWEGSSNGDEDWMLDEAVEVGSADKGAR